MNPTNTENRKGNEAATVLRAAKAWNPNRGLLAASIVNGDLLALFNQPICDEKNMREDGLSMDLGIRGLKMVQSQSCNSENTSGSQIVKHFRSDRRQCRCGESHSYRSDHPLALPEALSHLKNVDSFGLVFQTGSDLFLTNHFSTILDNHTAWRNTLLSEKTKSLVFRLLHLGVITQETVRRNKTTRLT